MFFSGGEGYALSDVLAFSLSQSHELVQSKSAFLRLRNTNGNSPFTTGKRPNFIASHGFF